MSAPVDGSRGRPALPVYDRINLAACSWHRAKGFLLYRRVFGSFGSRSAIYPPALIVNPRFIHIGERVNIGRGARLEAVLLDPEKPPELRIGNDVTIEEDVHIVAMGKVHIRDHASIAARSSLLCGTHPFFDVASAVKMGDRLSGAGAVIEIGEESFVGFGSVIQMNVRVGKRSLVGPNSVVKKNVPDDCAVEGNPAVVVRRCNLQEDRRQSAEG